MKKWLYSVMVKVCVSFKNSLFVWVYLKEVCFFRGCFYLVFILQNFGSLAPLIFFKQLFFIKIYFLSYETLHIFCFYKHTSFSRILIFFLLKQLFLVSDSLTYQWAII